MLILCIVLMLLTFLLHSGRGCRGRLVSETAEQYRAIRGTVSALQADAAADRSLSPGEEWLLDNFYMVRRAREDIENGLNRRLLRTLTLQDGVPAALAVARRLTAGDEAVREEAVMAALSGKEALQNADIRCFSLFLKIAIIEKIDKLCRNGLTDEAAGRDMKNAVVSLTRIRAINWESVFELTSPAEQILLQDPTNTYRNMDAASKESYRAAVERLARQCGTTETAVAEGALALARHPLSRSTRRRHIGCYLIAEGKPRLKEQLTGRPAKPAATDSMKCRRYLWAVGGVTALYLVITGVLAFRHGYSRWSAAFLLLFSLIPLSEYVLRLAGQLGGFFTEPRPMPALALDRVPESGACLVVVPALLTSPQAAEKLVKKLEILYLANRSEQLFFALLGDVKDAGSQTLPGDAAIHNAALSAVGALNRVYGNRFYYIGRRRVLNRRDKRYTGYERKRGALLELTRLLAGQETTCDILSCPKEALPSVSYICTLDSDTKTVKNGVLALLGAMLHPLNQPVFDEKSGRVTAGYGLLQPTICADSASAAATLYSRVFSPGLSDGYQGGHADFYFNAFAEGSFCGKGVFDLALYQKILNDKIPENRVLSHDLLEGGFLRTGIPAAPPLSDGFPGSYLADQCRRGRWIRGDWQLLPYLCPHIKNQAGHKEKNSLSLLTRFKIFNNLRRSLYELSVLVLFKYAFLLDGFWFLLPLGTALAVPLSELFLAVLSGLLHKEPRMPAKAALSLCMRFLFLPYGAYTAGHAILKALWRMAISRKKRLEWVTSQEAEAAGAATPGKTFKTMLTAQLISGVTAIGFSLFFTPALLPLALFFLVLWALAPAAAYFVSRPRQAYRPPEADRAYLLECAKKIFRYYYDFCGEQEHFLPPDNFQEAPRGGLAHRTSPTNIGLLLTALCCGMDFGFLSVREALSRLAGTMDTLDELEKVHGHLLNWYDTQTLAPLAPRFISTVDSGNLICLMLTARQALQELADRPEVFLERCRAADTAEGTGQETAELTAAAAREQATELIRRLDGFMKDCDFRFLYNSRRRIFSVGYDADRGVQTDAYYDLLATEARQTGFIAICKNQVPPSHWQSLDRPRAGRDGRGALLSWSGTMFEYLMPALLMKSHPGTLLYDSYRAAVRAQIHYAAKKQKPVWGISECAYFGFDASLSYRYRAMGVPSLALSREKHRDYVAAPYASFLALSVWPKKALRNLRRLETLGAVGTYGFYESVDFTKNHVGKDRDYEIVKTYMVHHLGMSLLAIANLLSGGVMQKRFAAAPETAACTYLYNEAAGARTPGRESLLADREASRKEARPDSCTEEYFAESVTRFAAVPRSLAVSAGESMLYINDRGAGFFESAGVRANRFDASLTRHPHGFYIYIKANGVWGGATYMPLQAAGHSAELTAGGAIFHSRPCGLSARLRVTLAPSGGAVLHELTVQNPGAETCVDAAGFFEATLTDYAADEAHPAFSGLFVETAFCPEEGVLLARRRPRGRGQKPCFLAFSLSGGERLSFESDRLQLLGRGGSAADPAFFRQETLSGTTGAVLDPAMALRSQKTLKKGETARFLFITVLADSREAALERVHALKSFSVPDAMKHLAAENADWCRARGITPQMEGLYGRWLSALFYPTCQKRPFDEYLTEPTEGQPGLWRFGISGDVPVILYLMHEDVSEADIKTLLLGCLYLRRRHIMLDLVLWDESRGGYHEHVQNRVRAALVALGMDGLAGQPGGVFLLSADKAGQADKRLLMTAARLLFDSRRPLAEQLYPDAFLQTSSASPGDVPPAFLPPAEPLSFANGYGGFAADGSYIIRLSGTALPPLPWAHIVANPAFGFLTTERGGGYVWADNARENKLTRWSNDPAGDPDDECFYLRDEESGALLSPVAGVLRDGGDYEIRYEPGRCVYRHKGQGLLLTLTQSVPVYGSVKLSQLSVTNELNTPKRLTVFYYVRPVLGAAASRTAHTLVSRRENGILTAENVFSGEPGLMFIGTDGKISSYTGNGRGFAPNAAGIPAALTEPELDCRTGALYDPCLALARRIELAPGETKALSFLLGAARHREETLSLCETYAKPGAAEKAMKKTADYWAALCGTVQVKTPSKVMDLLLNSWLLYQTCACRLMARTGFYQAGGAFGYRDQLQDALALLYADPAMTRRQILRHAAHQFREGDVQHWWHEDNGGGKGIRSRFSDDRLWLPYALGRYVAVTGNVDILEEKVPWLDAPPLKEGEDERYSAASVTAEKSTVYEHGLRALQCSMTCGAHGLPLMGSGDWNDGMNTVGNGGQGESVWLGWFLCAVIEGFLPLAEARGDREAAARLTEYRKALVCSLNENAWDGGWYRRAYFDDGTPLGTRESAECEIDSISQSWAVISGCGDGDKARAAMDAVREKLIDEEHGIIRLLTPPFGAGNLEPGYIKSYLAGVRENGGQYTHAAVWVVMAAALQGRGDEALRLFEMIAPMTHSDTKAKADCYKTEPYAVAADVYGAPPHEGRGGWTWYTGAAGWLYRVGLENILGVQKEGARLRLAPCVPGDWTEFTIVWHEGCAVYEITAKRGSGKPVLDGKTRPEDWILLTDDGRQHKAVFYFE